MLTKKFLRWLTLLSILFLLKVASASDDQSLSSSTELGIIASTRPPPSIREKGVENTCKDKRIKRNTDKKCVSAGSKCSQKKKASCCSAGCVFSSEKGSVADSTFSCNCRLSKQRERCNVDADCDKRNCSDENKKIYSCCETSKIIKSRKRCDCSKNECPSQSSSFSNLPQDTASITNN